MTSKTTCQLLFVTLTSLITAHVSSASVIDSECKITHANAQSEGATVDFAVDGTLVIRSELGFYTAELTSPGKISKFEPLKVAPIPGELKAFRSSEDQTLDDGGKVTIFSEVSIKTDHSLTITQTAQLPGGEKSVVTILGACK